MSLKILIIEDEPDIRKNLEYNLSREGYSVLTAASIAEAEQLIYSNNLSLVLLDLMLPDGSGLELCKKMKSDPDIQNLPIIILTAKDDEVDKVVGFEIGADDYVTKPFSVRELILRIKAVLKRGEKKKDIVEIDRQFGDLKIDIDSHEVYVDGELVNLTALEFKLLIQLVDRRGRVQSREQLLTDVGVCGWGRPVLLHSRRNPAVAAAEAGPELAGGGRGAMLYISGNDTPASKALKGTKDWTQVKMRLKSGLDTSLTITCLFGGWGIVTGKAWWDDVSLRKVTYEVIESDESESVAKGNVERGKKIFMTHPIAACTRCHVVKGVGGPVGPVGPVSPVGPVGLNLRETNKAKTNMLAAHVAAMRSPDSVTNTPPQNAPPKYPAGTTI